MSSLNQQNMLKVVNLESNHAFWQIQTYFEVLAEAV